MEFLIISKRMGVNKMAAEKGILNADQKRKILLVLRILLLTAAVIYLVFFVINNFSADDNEFNVYFSNSDATFLEKEKRKITKKEDLYQQLFKELKTGPKSKELRPTIPEGVSLLDYQIKDKTIVLNFNQELRDNHWGGSTGEIMTVYSIVNTYTSLKDIEKVKILLENKEIESLVGHLDLTGPLMYNQKLVK